MAASPLNVYQGQPGSTETVVYTVPAGKTLILLGIICANTSGTAASARVSVLPAGGSSATTANQIIPDAAVPAHDRIDDDTPTVLPAGGKIAVQGSTSAVTITISGVLL